MLMDSKMQDLDCHYLQFDELWGFINRKRASRWRERYPEQRRVWTFCAMNSGTN